MKSTYVELLVSSLGGVESKCQFIVAGVDVGIHVFVRVDVFLHLGDHLTCNFEIIGDGVEASISEDEGLGLVCVCLFGLEVLQEGKDFAI